MPTSKRVYTPTALEAWLHKLGGNWERHFEATTLETARQLYRKGFVREIELGTDDAIIHAKADGEAVYAVVDWNGGGPSVRYSREASREGYALAAAGLYEIEELVAEEVSPLPPEKTEETTKETTKEADAQEEKAEKHSVRALIVGFFAAGGTLAFRAFWEEEGERQVPAIGEGSETELQPKEREQLILLSTSAHRAGFRYDGRKGRYGFQDLEALPLFLRKDWGVWQERFTVELSPEVEGAFAGVQAVDFEVEAEAAEEGGARLRWKASAGENIRLSKSELSKLLRRKEVPVLLPGKGLFRLAEGRSELVRQWEGVLDVGLEGEVPRYLLFSLFREAALNLKLSSELKVWREAFFREPVREGTLREELRDYQRAGVWWLRHLCECGAHPLLADEMGLGKTLQVLSLMAARPVEGLPSLIVCPASVLPVWEAEVARFFPEMRTRWLRKGQAFGNAPEEAGVLWLASYSQLRRHKALLSGVEFGYCVLDEAQFIKNPEAKVSQACYAIRARHRLALTGTPLENHYRDVWALFRFLMPGLLGSRQRFEREAESRGGAFAGFVRQQMAPFTLRRRKADVLEELPEKVELELLCPLSALQRKLYTKVAEEGVATFGKRPEEVVSEQRMHLFALLTRLRQLSCDPGLLPGMESVAVAQSGKLGVLREKLQELLEGGHKVVVFSQFVRLLERVKQGLSGEFPGQCFMLTGHTRERATPVRVFQQQEGAAVMLVSLKAGGTGITLHAADYVFLLDPWWNPAVEAQAIDRVHRIGQEKRVFVYRMIARGTLEERIRELQKLKRERFEEVVEEMGDGSKFLDYVQDLEALVKLTDNTSDDDEV